MDPVRELGGLVGGQQVGDRHDQGRVGADARLPIDLVGELGQGLHAVLGARLGQLLSGPLEHLVRDGGLVAGKGLVDVQARVEGRQVALAGKAGHGAAVAGRAGPHRRFAVGGAKAPVAAGHLEAGRQALEVPLERAGQGLVEVVDVEVHAPLGGAEDAEVGEVGVAAELGAQVGGGRGGQVAGHDQGGAAVEGEGRDQHAPVADRHQLGHAALGLALEQGDRVGALGAGVELGVGRAGHVGPRGLAARDPLGDGGVLDRGLGRDAAVVLDLGRHEGSPFGSSGLEARAASLPTTPRAARRPPRLPPPRRIQAKPTARAAPASGPTT